MIIIDNVTKKFGDRILFEDVACSFAPGNRYGLTGPNGAGKSTLLKIAIGASDATSGNVVLPKKFGFLKQDITEFENIKVIDVVMMGNNKLWQTLLKRDALYDKEMTDAVGMRLAELEEIVEAEGGYTADSDAEILLHGIGLSSDEFTKEMKEIPLDHQFRVLLCQALFGKPEALLLDEPTNHLDMQSINWLENFLTNYDGALVVISHDRHFLNSVCTHIADIDYDTIIVYPGNYDDMIVAKSQVRARIEMDNKAKSKKVSQLKEFVAKFSKGTRASQVQSRIKEINRLAPQDLKRSNIQRPFICFEESDKRAGTIPFKLNKLSKSFDDTQVIKKFSLEINRGEKIGVIGNNGAGKTTLVRLIAGNLPPDAGHVILGNQVEIGYFPQNHSDIVDKSSDETMLDWLRSRVPPVYEQEIRGALGKLLFSGDDAFKPISTLSGGETARLILAQLMLNKFNTLVLDEPNNHLDIESVSALSQSIENFHGTVVIVSHDRDLIGSVASKIIAFEESGIQIFAGSLEEYLSNKESVKQSMSLPMGKNKFLSLCDKSKHKFAAALLAKAYVNRATISVYNTVAEWLRMKAVTCDHESISNRYHLHLQQSHKILKEYDLLPNVVHLDEPSQTLFLDINIYLDGLRSAHNVGSIIRTTEAFRLGSIYTSANMPSIEHNKVKKSAMGCETIVECHHDIDLSELNKPLIAIETHKKATPINKFHFPSKFTLILGNEEYGLSKHSLEIADHILYIPLPGSKNSINVSCAFSIVAYEISKQLHYTQNKKMSP